MSVIDEAVTAWKARLSEVEKQLAPLAREADDLRQAIAKIESAGTTTRQRRSGSGRGTRGGRSRSTSGRRAPRGRNRELILAAIKSDAKTAGEVAAETGIGRATVSTTLSKLAKEGAAVRAKRGYRAA